MLSAIIEIVNFDRRIGTCPLDVDVSATGRFALRLCDNQTSLFNAFNQHIVLR